MEPNLRTQIDATTTPRQPLALLPGEQWGDFDIIRFLGKGGMGEVYEATERQAGRRVALKVLSRAAIDSDAAHRFLREGRAAAAVSHPNSVYVFGSHQVNGTLAIAMEIVEGGTLQELVDREGPLPPLGAVEAVLQLIAGLDAAAARGVLHRDIKPSNCFIDRSGVVKVGDYGLAMSVEADSTRLTIDGTFLGTPAYASPEQVHGRALDVRADIYSVGATLYFLLTGQPPFVRDGAVQMLAAVLQDTPESPRKLAPSVPEALAQVVLRTLHKNPADRYRSYSELRAALAPFARQTFAAAPLPIRIVAGMIDALVLLPVQMMLLQFQEGRIMPSASIPGLLASLATTSLYFLALEGRWGASLGKRLLRLRVVDADGEVASFRRVLVRTLIYCVLLTLPDAASLPAGGGASFVVALIVYAVVFCTARAANGWRGIHELWSGTRTVRHVATEPQAFAAAGEVAVEEANAALAAPRTRIGAYVVRRRVWSHGDTALDLTRDESLQRDVWILHQSASTAAVADARRGLARSTRVRWLGSSETASGRWTAYEAPAGAPLHRARWEVARHWLAALGREVAEAVADGTLPDTLTVRHVWITQDGVVKLLDFPATRPSDADAQFHGTDLATAQEFLQAVASTAIAAEQVHALPGSARALLETIARRGFATMAELVQRLASATTGATEVSRLHRAVGIMMSAALPLMMLLVVVTRVPASMALRHDPTLDRIDLLLSELRTQNSVAGEGPTSVGYRVGRGLSLLLRRAETDVPDRSPAARRAFAIVLIDQYGGVLSDERTWSALAAESGPRARELRQLVDEARAQVATASVEERQSAGSRAASILHYVEARAAQRPTAGVAPYLLILGPLYFALTMVGVCAIVLALLFRGPLALRLLGYELVTRRGLAGRARAAVRAAVAWSPGLIGLMLMRWLTVTGIALSALAMVVMIAGAVWMVFNQRSVQDRVAGTWIVPR